VLNLEIPHEIMRILQKQPNGEWKVHRTIWNENLRESAHSA
jgi:hypothetical protein